jgi:hypothetical protein
MKNTGRDTTTQNCGVIQLKICVKLLTLISFQTHCCHGQTLNFYDKFLLPMKKVLTEFKYCWTDNAYAESGYSGEYSIKGKYLSAITLPQKTVTIDGSNKTVTINGSERVNYYEDIDNLINQCKSNGLTYYSHPDAGYSNRGYSPLGYSIGLHREQWRWNGYDGEGDYSLYKADVWSDLHTIWEGFYHFEQGFPARLSVSNLLI